MVRPYLKILWQDNSAKDSDRSKKERTTEEEMGRKHQRMDRNVVWRFTEGGRKQGKVEWFCCATSSFCGPATTVKARGLR